MKRSTEFSTWVALAFGAIAIAICAFYSSSLFVLTPVGLAGGVLGYTIVRISRFYFERYLNQKHLR